MYHKPIYEAVSLHSSRRSILAFDRVDRIFEPFWHYHPEVELTLITRGSGLRFVGDSIESYTAGDLILIGENLPHQWVSEQGIGPDSQSAIVVQFQKELFAEYLGFKDIFQLLTKAGQGLCFEQVPSALTDRLTGIVSAPSAIQVSELIAILYELTRITEVRTLSVTDRLAKANTVKGQERINSVLKYTLANLDKKLTVAEVAEYSHMVPQSFCRWFRQHTGSSFITYLNKSRIESARQALLTTNKPVRQIAFEVGFENISHFNRTFRKYSGASPLKYKKQFA